MCHVSGYVLNYTYQAHHFLSVITRCASWEGSRIEELYGLATLARVSKKPERPGSSRGQTGAHKQPCLKVIVSSLRSRSGGLEASSYGLARQVVASVRRHTRIPRPMSGVLPFHVHNGGLCPLEGGLAWRIRGVREIGGELNQRNSLSGQPRRRVDYTWNAPRAC